MNTNKFDNKEKVYMFAWVCDNQLNTKVEKNNLHIMSEKLIYMPNEEYPNIVKYIDKKYQLSKKGFIPPLANKEPDWFILTCLMDQEINHNQVLHRNDK